LADFLDRRLHDPDDVERLTGSRALVHLPPTIFPGSEPDPAVPLAFQMLRDSLMYFNVDEGMDSLMVLSAMKGEGKTTVALNLSMVYARPGRRVVLVDADLRGSVLQTRMRLTPSAGLTGVLAGEHALESTLQEIEPFGENLRVLPAGRTTPNPSELLGSARMASVLDELKADSDLVIIDTAPLLLVSDAMSLLRQVSGALGVVRLEQTTRDAIRRLNELVAMTDTRMYGLAVTGGGPTSGYGYGYGYGREYAAPVNGPEPAPALARDRLLR
jgi:polysaccharide biosynthesis transport protein